MEKKVNTDVLLILNKLKWITAKEEFQMTDLTLDCYHFWFPDKFPNNMQYELLVYMEEQYAAGKGSIVDTAIWLYQNHIPFHIKYRYNKQRPFLYNLKMLIQPKKLENLIQKYPNELIVANGLLKKKVRN